MAKSGRLIYSLFAHCGMSSRRLINGSSLLDRAGILPGNVVCRSLGEDYADLHPGRDAWHLGTHALRWEPDAR